MWVEVPAISQFACEEPGLESGTLVPSPPPRVSANSLSLPVFQGGLSKEQRVSGLGKQGPARITPVTSEPQSSSDEILVLTRPWGGARKNSQVLVAFAQQLPDILTQTFFPHLVGIQPWCWRHCSRNRSWKRPRSSLSWSSLSDCPPEALLDARGSPSSPNSTRQRHCLSDRLPQHLPL